LQKAKDRRREEAELRILAQEAVTKLQDDPQNLDLQTQLGILSARLHEVELRLAEGQRIRSRVKWKQYGDSCSKEFFKATCEHFGASSIMELEDENGEVSTDQASLERICQQYYSKLYSERPQSAERGRAEAQALNSISDHLSVVVKARLNEPIRMEELDVALKGMPSGKASGPTGVLTEFYKQYWSLIKQDYLEMVHTAVRLDHFPPGVTRGMISLLHKNRERSKLTNWRSITLLNVAYKLFAKTLQLRLQPVLMDIISYDQSAFLLLRFILDNILLTHETIDWADFLGQPLIFLKLDFSKAYDMVDWPFLFRAMERLGFPREFVSMTKLLFHEASAIVKVNGLQSASFSI
jgi:hypothetical protein